jgi:hypothetical protein
MTTLTSDTYHFVERLEKAGMPREQAVAFAEAQKESLAEALDSGLVTRGDLFEVKAELKADIASLRWDTGLSSSSVCSCPWPSAFSLLLFACRTDSLLGGRIKGARLNLTSANVARMLIRERPVRYPRINIRATLLQVTVKILV